MAKFIFKVEEYNEVFKKVDEFEGYKNPREEQYNFNVASMK